MNNILRRLFAKRNAPEPDRVGLPDTNVMRVRAALLARSQRGFEKYGTTTDRTDLSLLDWLQHLQEELLDAAVYLERIKEELRTEQCRN